MLLRKHLFQAGMRVVELRELPASGVLAPAPLTSLHLDALSNERNAAVDGAKTWAFGPSVDPEEDSFLEAEASAEVVDVLPKHLVHVETVFDVEQVKVLGFVQNVQVQHGLENAAEGRGGVGDQRHGLVVAVGVQDCVRTVCEDS